MKKVVFLFLSQLLFSGLMAQNPAVDSIASYDAVLKTPTGDIYGTLTVPLVNERTPVVLFIAGSGETNRDCNSKSARIHTNAYKFLAENLAKNGISSLRFDKRGVAQSAGAAQNTVLKFEDHITDVLAWITYLKQEKSFSRIIILGHGEGSLIGMVAANKSPVGAFISISGAGKPADQTLRDYLKNRMQPGMEEESKRILDSLAAGKMVATADTQLLAIFHPDKQPFLISWMKYDPVKEIARLKMPVLIVQGKDDLVVNPDNALLLSNGNKNARLLMIDNMNYVLKNTGGDSNVNKASYIRPDIPLHEELVKGIIDFISTLNKLTL
jgi:pimeloyl-ACP methyl ester carboxylesterase